MPSTLVCFTNLSDQLSFEACMVAKSLAFLQDPCYTNFIWGRLRDIILRRRSAISRIHRDATTFLQPAIIALATKIIKLNEELQTDHWVLIGELADQFT